MAEGVRVRPPLPADAPALAALAGELGYPTTAEELLGRLAALDPTDAAVIVSTDADDVPTGWCHVEMRRTLVEPISALILGLVVGEGHQSAGIGHSCWGRRSDGREGVAVGAWWSRPASRVSGRIGSTLERATRCRRRRTS